MPNTIQFYFQLVEKVEHVQTFQLIEINFEFVENVIFFVITLNNFTISRNRIQLNGLCNDCFTHPFHLPYAFFVISTFVSLSNDKRYFGIHEKSC